MSKNVGFRVVESVRPKLKGIPKTCKFKQHSKNQLNTPKLWKANSEFFINLHFLQTMLEGCIFVIDVKRFWNPKIDTEN